MFFGGNNYLIFKRWILLTISIQLSLLHNFLSKCSCSIPIHAFKLSHYKKSISFCISVQYASLDISLYFRSVPRTMAIFSFRIANFLFLSILYIVFLNCLPYKQKISFNELSFLQYCHWDRSYTFHNTRTFFWP